MVPAVILPLESMPLLPSGKVNRRALPQPPELDEEAEKEEYVPPEDEVRTIVSHTTFVHSDCLHLSPSAC